MKLDDLYTRIENPIDNIGSLANKDNVLTVIQDGEILKNSPIF